jgi:quinol monooxygenase YgiN
MGTIIYKDTFKIESEKKKAESNLATINQNYTKVKDLGFDYEIAFLASDYRGKKEKLREALAELLKQKDPFLNKAEVASRIREIEKKLYYNQFDESGNQLEGEKYLTAVAKNIKQLDTNFQQRYDVVRLIQFDDETDSFVLIENYEHMIEIAYTYSCQNEKQERVLQLINEMVDRANEIKQIVPRFNLSNETNYKRSEAYKLILSIK